MNRKRTFLTLILIGLSGLVVAAGCSESQAATLSSPASKTTREIEPTAPPPTPAVITLTVATPTPQPTEPPGRQSAPSLTRAIPSPTPSSTKESPDASPEEDTLKAEVTVAAGNVRSGPGLAYPVIGQVSRGDVLVVLGRNAPGDWLQIARDDRSGWLSSSLVKLNSAITGLEVVEVLVPPPASPTPTPQPSEVPYCDSVPIRGFGTIWGEHPSVAATLGCPSWPYREQGTGAAAQTFGHGLMLWLAADTSGGGDPVYVLFDTGEYQRFPDMGPADPAVVGDIPAGFYPPGDRFSKVYWEGTGVRVRQRLGYATGPQIDSPGAYQQFWNGRMFWAGALDRIFVLYDYWQWDEPGENGVQIRSWVGFQDTFGD
jgi:hypothetical protein